MILDGLVIRRRLQGNMPAYWSTVRLFQGDHMVADIQVRDLNGSLPVGEQLDVSLETKT